MFTQFVNYIQKNVGTTAVTLVTCPASNQLVVNQLSCANTTGLTVTCSVTVTRSSTVVFIVNNATVPAGGSLICAGDDQKIVLMAGDVLQVTSSLASSIDAVVSGVLNDFNRSAVVPAPPVSPVATFSITPSTTSTFEGNTVTYSVTTTNVPNGTVLYWQNFGTTTAQDFTDDRNDGEFVITGGAGSFTRTLRTTGQGGDPGGESTETIQIALQFRPGYLGGGAVAGAATVTVLPDTVVTSGLILNLDAGNFASYPGSGTIWTNLAGVGNNGTLINGPTFNSANGGSIVFDSVDDYVDLGSAIQLSNNFTLSSWFIDSNGGFILDQGNPGGDPTGCMEWTTNGLALNSNNISSVAANGTVNTAVWNNVVCSFASGQVTFYINGVLDSVKTASWTSFSPSGILKIGRRAFNNSSKFSGRISNVTIYNRVLTSTEVQQNFSSLRGRYGI